MYRSIRPWLFKLDPEFAHVASRLIARAAQSVAPHALRAVYEFDDKALSQEIWGVTFPNPVGLAAGFDKNAQLLPFWEALGFGHVEIGSVTAEPSRGNPRPRLFRLSEDRAIINRLGLPNHGASRIARRLARTRTGETVATGVSIAKTHDPTITGAAAVEDYCVTFLRLAPVADYVSLNISCPNTADGRTFEEAECLDELLSAIRQQCSRFKLDIPVLLKLSPPDTAKVIYDSLLEDILSVALSHRISGFVVCNTAADRTGLRTSAATVAAMGPGGLSGAPLFGRSLRMVEYVYSRTDGLLPIVAVGGISTAEDAYRMICAGASLVQMYTGLVYEGPMVVHDLKQGLAALLKRDGFSSIGDAVGCNYARSASLTPDESTPSTAVDAAN